MKDRIRAAAPGRTLLPVIVGLAVALLIVYVVWPSADDGRGGEATVIESPPVVGRAPMDLPEGSAPGDIPSDIRVPEMPTLADPAAVSEAGAMETPTGGLLLTVLWGDDGSPAIDVGVSVIAWSAPRHAQLRTAFTGADGTLRLDGLAPGRASVHGDRGGSVSVDVQPGEIVEAVLELPVGPWVHGVVLNPDAAPVVGADIWLSDYGNQTTGQVVTTSSTGGRFSIRSVSGGHSVGARDHESGSWGPSPLVRIAETEAARIDIVLELTRGAGTVRLSVLDGEDAPVPDAQVLLGGEQGWRFNGSADAWGGTAPPLRGRTDEHGAVAWSGVPTGPTRLIVRAPGFSPHEQTLTVEGGGEHGVDVLLQPPARVSGFVARIVDGQIVRIEGVRITATRKQGPAVRYGDLLYTETTSGTEGRWSMEGPATGRVTITAAHEEYGKADRRLTIVAGGVYEDVSFPLSRGLEIHGTVVDEHGAPMPEWIVQVERTYSANGWRGQAVADAGGRFAIPNCKETSHTLTVMEPRWRSFTPVLVREGVVPGAVAVELVVPSDATASAEILFVLQDPAGQPVSDAASSVSSPDGQQQGQIVALQQPGAYRTKPLPPGDYALRIWSGRHPELLVEGLHLDPAESLDLGVLTLREGGRLLVRLSRPAELEDRATSIMVSRPGGVWRAGLREAPDGWWSDPLLPGSYRVLARSVGAAEEALMVDVRAGETTEVDIELALGVPHLFEIHGLAESPTVAAFDEREHGHRWYRIDVQDSSGRPVTRVRGSVDYVLAKEEPAKGIAQLATGDFTARVLIGDIVVAEADFTVFERMDERSVTRLDVVR